MTSNEIIKEVINNYNLSFTQIVNHIRELDKKNNELEEKIEWLQHSWIPTSERLPNEKEFMRNYSRDNHSTEFVVMIEGATIPTVLQYKSDGVWTDEARNWYNVVAWMELPDPWKGDLV